MKMLDDYNNIYHEILDHFCMRHEAYGTYHIEDYRDHFWYHSAENNEVIFFDSDPRLEKGLLDQDSWVDSDGNDYALELTSDSVRSMGGFFACFTDDALICIFDESKRLEAE